MINIPRLMNKMIVKAHQNGKKIDENYADKSLVGLITKRFNTPKNSLTKQYKFSTISTCYLVYQNIKALEKVN